MIRVVVAEDSLTVRELLVQVLEADPQIAVVGQAKDGAEAVELAIRLRPDLITMDIEMPNLDGLAATKEIMIAAPTPIVIVSRRATRRNIELALDATRAGALMVLPTPDNPQSADFEKMCDEFLMMVKALAGAPVVRHWRQRASRTDRVRVKVGGVKVIAIAASTGGPAALYHIFGQLPRTFAVPILVVQHIAAGFAEGLAQWLRTGCQLRVKIAEAGEPIGASTVYLAPDNRHLGVSAEGRVVLDDSEPIGGFRPSADYLFQSIARGYHSHAVGVVLTGMGRDGLGGVRALYKAGGRIIAQDEASSVVFGMPREVIREGIAHEVLAPETIAVRLTEIVSGNYDHA